MNQVALELVRRWESCRLSAYLDTGDVCTVGWGATGPDITIDTVWTQQQADERLADDLQSSIAAVRKHVIADITPNQEAALISFVFNLGETQFRKSTLLTRVNAGDDIAAALEFTRWHHDNGRKIKGLLRRRLDEAALYLKP